MPNYRRAWCPGGTYFFTVNLLERRKSLLTEHIDLLRDSVREVRRRFPFTIHGWVVLPEHLHCVIELPGRRSGFFAALAPDKIWILEGLAADRAAIGCARATR